MKTKKKTTKNKKLTAKNYFSLEMQKKYMGVSQFKTFEDCPARAMAELRGDYQRTMGTALLVGSYVDAHFEGTLDLFKAQHSELFKRDGSLKAEYIKAEDIISRIERDDMFMEYMSGKKQVIMTGNIAGVEVKIKIDSLCPDKIVDLKIMRDFESIYKTEQGRLPWYEAWRYDLQGAVYQEIYRQNTGETLPFYLAAATKEPVSDIGIWHISDEALQFELARFAERVPIYDAMKHGIMEAPRCEKCDWCKQTKVLTEAIESEDEFDE